MAYNDRGNAWSAKKEYDKAIADYNKAIGLDPKLAAAYNAPAWLWATCPEANTATAREPSSRPPACELTEWKEPIPRHPGRRLRRGRGFETAMERGRKRSRSGKRHGTRKELNSLSCTRRRNPIAKNRLTHHPADEPLSNRGRGRPARAVDPKVDQLSLRPQQINAGIGTPWN